MENNDRQDAQAAPQQEQGTLEYGLIPEGEQYDPGFIPEGDYDPEGGYDPAGGYYPEDDYDPGSEYDPEGGYDPGFVPDGEHTPGSEYDPGFVPEGGYDSGSEDEGGYDPIFTWGGFEDDVAAGEPVDAPAAEPSGGAPPLETGARADAAGNPEIEMYSDDVGQAGDAGDGEIEMPPEHVGRTGADAGDAEIEMTGDEEIEMPPEYAGQAGAAGQEPNDDPVLLGAPAPESVEQAGADTGDGEIEMPPMILGQADADAGDGETEEIESTPEDAPIGIRGAFQKLKRQAEADSGVNENDIEIHDDAGDEHPASAAYQKYTAAKQAYLRDVAYEEELAEFDTYEKLAAYYKEVMTTQPHTKRNPNNLDFWNKLDPQSREDLDTYDELKAALKEQMELRDIRFETRYELEKSYDKKFEYLLKDSRYDDYDELAAHYKETYRILERSQEEPSLSGLDTYRELKIAFYELWQKHDRLTEEQS